VTQPTRGTKPPPLLLQNERKSKEDGKIKKRGKGRGRKGRKGKEGRERMFNCCALPDMRSWLRHWL